MLSARSGALPFVQHSYAGLHSTSGVSGVRLRCALADTRHPLRSAAALLRCASLSLRTLGRSEKRCLSTATQSLGVFVRCRQSRPLWYQLPKWSRRLRHPPSPALSSLRSLEIRSLRLPPSPALSSLRSLRKAVSRHCFAEPRRFCAVSAAPSALVPAN